MTSGDWSWLLQALQPPPAPDVPLPPPRPPLLGQSAVGAPPRAAAGPAAMSYAPAAPPPVPTAPAPAPVPTPTPRPPNVAGEFGDLAPPAANPDPSQSMQARQMIVNLVNRGLISPDQLSSVFGRMQ